MKVYNQMRIASGLSSFFLPEQERRVGERIGEEDMTVVYGVEAVENLDLTER